MRRRELILLETRAAQHRTALSGAEWDGGLLAARGAICSRLSANARSPVGTLRFALLAALRVVFEIFIVEK